MKKDGRSQRLLACYGEPSRFRVVTALLAGECCVSDLAAMVGLSQSCTTRHLQALVREGLVAGKREGKRVIFRVCLEEPRIAEIVQWAAAGRDAPHDRGRPTLSSDGPAAPPAFDAPSSRSEGSEDLATPDYAGPARDGSDPPDEIINPGAETEAEMPSPALRRGDIEDFLL